MALLVWVLILSFIENGSCVLNPSIASLQSSAAKDDLIEWYFKRGFGYNEILLFLLNCHGIHMSLRSLHRVLRRKNLSRKKEKSGLYQVLHFIQRELAGSGNNVGYRSMHQRVIAHGLKIDIESVRLGLKALDPHGVSYRARHRLKRRKYGSRGSNFIWHMDGNDKLLPFGFAIHGAINGYSRRILWLSVSPTSKSPSVISMYYANYIEQLEGVPHKIRADRGVENAYVAGIQRFLRRSHNDKSAGYSSFIFGKSTSNQRIEVWWSFLRRNRLNWWMNYFKDLHDQGLYDDSNPIHVQCLKFCFYSILQDELDETRHYWNHHRIRPSRAASSPPGRPDVLYFLPQNQNKLDHKRTFDEEEFLLAKSLYCRNNPIFCCNDEFAKLAFIVMSENDLDMPMNVEEAEMLYLELVYHITQI